MENLSLCLTILITGFVVVFAVLILLIIIIKIYGVIVTKALKAAQDRKERKQKALDEAKKQQAVQAAKAAAEAEPEPLSNEKSAVQGISPEIVAVIAAAVDSTYGTGAARITSIKKSKTPNSRPAWGMAGVFENTRPF